MITKIETYGGFSIAYDEDESQFVATHEKDETVTPLRSKELKPLRTRIDNFNDPQEKKKREQPKQLALELSENHKDGFSIAEKVVGSFGMVMRRWGGSGTLYAWVTNRRGSDRRRMEISDRFSGWRSGFFVEDTPKNRATIEKMKAVAMKKKEAVEKFESEIETLKETLTKVQPKIEEVPEWEQ